MSEISLDLAKKLAEEALAEGRRSECKPLTVAVLDPGGHLKAMFREDGSGILRPEIAIGKAVGALGMGLGSRSLSRLAEERARLLASISALTSKVIIPAAGGVLIHDKAGNLVCAVGISGDTSDLDEACILAAAEKLGLSADPGN